MTKTIHVQDAAKYTVRPWKADVAHYRAKADKGLIPQSDVIPLAAVRAAMRKAQTLIGPGHTPLDAVFEAVPELYGANWLAKRIKMAA